MKTYLVWTLQNGQWVPQQNEQAYCRKTVLERYSALNGQTFNGRVKVRLA